MSIGSLSSGTVSTATLAAADSSARAREAASPTIADHVASADEHEPVRSFSSSLGTLIDTYL